MHTSFSNSPARKSHRRSLFRRVLVVMLGALSLAPMQAAVAQTDISDFYVVFNRNNQRGQSTLATLQTTNRFGFGNVIMANQRRITGLQRNERILGIDFRPATGQLYGLGSSGRLYVIDTFSAAATAIGGSFAIPLVGSSFGFDFNPVVDRIRVTSDAGQNLRLNPNTGAVVDSNVGTTAIDPDGDLSFGDDTDDDPNVAGSAYTNSDNDTTTGTLLYNIDTVQDTLVTQGSEDGTVSPNSGQLFTVGSLGYDATSPLGFDIVTFNGVNTAYAIFSNRSIRRNLNSSGLFNIDLATGAATPVARIINAQYIVGFAIAPPADDIPETED
jgi:hypothetical protein